MATGPCPADPDRLRGLLQDLLPASEQAELTAHLESCPPCRRALEHLAAGSQFWDELRLLRGPAPVGTLTSSAADRAGLEAEAVRALHFLDPPAEPGSLGRLGSYDLLEVVGRGGMGIVLKALDRSLDRLVAIKVLDPALAPGAAARRRFAREARAAAAVAHEHVVVIHAVDAAPNGLPYLVMQYVPGNSLQQRLDRGGPLELRETLRIGMQAASALAAAHAQGLIHRDIKPSNILLENGIERVKITDFGLARAIDDAAMTDSGVVAGTPQYMSPEQARGEAVDHRTDLFSLGSVLYALCTGRAPFRGGSSLATLHRVCQETPPPIRELNPDIPDWMVRIVERLHAKDPAGRFATAAELARLLERALAHLQQPTSAPLPAELAEPMALPDRSGEPSRRKAKFRWAIAAAFLSAVAIGLAGAPGIAQQVADYVATVLRIRTADGTLVIEAEDPSVKVHIDGEIVIEGAGFQEVRLKPGAHQFRAVRDGVPIRDELISIARGGRRLVTIRRESGAASTADAAVGERRPAPPATEVRPSVGPVGAAPSATPRRAAPRRSVTALAYSPDGKSLAIAVGSRGRSGGLYVRDLAARTTQSFPEPSPGGVRCAAWSPDGKTLAQARDGGVLLREFPSGRIRVTVKGPGLPIYTMAFSPDGKLLATGGQDKSVRIWDAASGAEVRLLTADMQEVWAVAFSPDGKLLASGATGGVVRLWDVATGKVRRRLVGHQAGIHAVAFSPDGKLVATGSWDNHVGLWEMGKGQPPEMLSGHKFPINALAFSADGTRLVSASGDAAVEGDDAGAGEVILWDVPGRRAVQPVGLLPARVRAVAMSPDGKRIAQGDDRGTVMVYDPSGPSLHYELPQANAAGSARAERPIGGQPDPGGDLGSDEQLAERIATAMKQLEAARRDPDDAGRERRVAEIGALIERLRRVQSARDPAPPPPSPPATPKQR